MFAVCIIVLALLPLVFAIFLITTRIILEPLGNLLASRIEDGDDAEEFEKLFNMYVGLAGVLIMFVVYMFALPLLQYTPLCIVTGIIVLFDILLALKRMESTIDKIYTTILNTETKEDGAKR